MGCSAIGKNSVPLAINILEYLPVTDQKSNLGILIARG
jgi:hypothetical protein